MFNGIYRPSRTALAWSPGPAAGGPGSNGPACGMVPQPNSFDGGMDLTAAFLDAMPTPQWPEAAHGGALVAFISCADWAPWLPQAAGLLDAQERGRVARKRRAGDRELTTLAYACHRLLLAAVLDRPPERVPLRRDAQGCPRLDGDVAWTSLSHADGLIALAVSGGGRVGIDIEPLARTAEMPEIAASVAHPREMAALSALPEPQRATELLALWVRKEALLKAAGIGLAQTMASFEAPPDTPLALPGGGQTGKMRIRMLEGHGAWMAAVATGEAEPVASAWLRPRR